MNVSIQNPYKVIAGYVETGHIHDSTKHQICLAIGAVSHPNPLVVFVLIKASSIDNAYISINTYNIILYDIYHFAYIKNIFHAIYVNIYLPVYKALVPIKVFILNVFFYFNRYVINTRIPTYLL